MGIHPATSIDVHRRIGRRIPTSQTTCDGLSKAGCLSLRVGRSDALPRLTCHSHLATTLPTRAVLSAIAWFRQTTIMSEWLVIHHNSNVADSARLRVRRLRTSRYRRLLLRDLVRPYC